MSLKQKQAFNNSTAQHFCNVCTHDVEGSDIGGDILYIFVVWFLFLFLIYLPHVSPRHGKHTDKQMACSLIAYCLDVPHWGSAR